MLASHYFSSQAQMNGEGIVCKFRKKKEIYYWPDWTRLGWFVSMCHANENQ
jgi:hypothetical protein